MLGMLGELPAFLIERQVPPQEETQAWHCKLGQESRAGELTGSRKEPTTIILLNGQTALSMPISTSIYIY